MIQQYNKIYKIHYTQAWIWISASHKVEISECFKSHWLEFKGQSSNLKHVEKIDE